MNRLYESLMPGQTNSTLGFPNKILRLYRELIQDLNKTVYTPF